MWASPVAQRSGPGRVEVANQAEDVCQYGPGIGCLVVGDGSRHETVAAYIPLSQ